MDPGACKIIMVEPKELLLIIITVTVFTLIEKDHLGDRSPEKDCC